MRILMKALCTPLLALAAASCTPTGGNKEMAAPYAPTVTQADLDADTQTLAERTSELESLGLQFEMRTRYDHAQIAVWRAGARPTRFEGSQITALERFIETAEAYLRKYQLYTLDGRVQTLPEATKSEIGAKLKLARAKLEELRPTTNDRPVSGL